MTMAVDPSWSLSYLAEQLITHADFVDRDGYDFRVRLFVCLSVCLFVCLFVNSITQKRMIPKCSNLVQALQR